MSQQQVNIDRCVHRRIDEFFFFRKKVGKQSDPVKPVAKRQQIGSRIAQAAIKPPLTTADSGSVGQPPVKRQKIVPSSTDSIAIDAAKSVVPVAVVTPSLPVPNVSGHSDETENHTETDSDVNSIQMTSVIKNGCRWDRWELVNRTAGVFVGKFHTDGPGAELECFYLKRIGHGKFSFWFKSVPKAVKISLEVRVQFWNQPDETETERGWKASCLGHNVVDLTVSCCEDNSCAIGCETSWIKRVAICDLRLTIITDQKNPDSTNVKDITTAVEAANSNDAVAAVTPQSVKKPDSTKPVVKPQQTQSKKEGQVGLKPPLSAVNSGSVGQPPVNQQKIAQSPGDIVNVAANSAAAVVGVPAPPPKLVSGDKTETRVSQLEEENIRLTSNLFETRQKRDRDVAEAELKLTEKTVELLTQLRSNNDQLKLECKTQVGLVAQLREEKLIVEENLTGEINRQSILIDKKSKVEEDLRVQLRQKTEEVLRLTASINQAKIDKANLPPAYPGWTTDFPDFNLISADDFAFPVSRAILCLKTPVFKADLSTDAAKKACRIKAAYKADVMLELLKFLCGQDFTANLPVVAKRLIKAAKHYQLTELTEVCEEELVEQLTFDTLIFTIRLADQLKSDELMSESFKFVKREKANKQMWEDLNLQLQLPKILAQINVFSGGKNAKCPKFDFSP